MIAALPPLHESGCESAYETVHIMSAKGADQHFDNYFLHFTCNRFTVFLKHGYQSNNIKMLLSNIFLFSLAVFRGLANSYAEKVSSIVPRNHVESSITTAPAPTINYVVARTETVVSTTSSFENRFATTMQ